MLCKKFGIIRFFLGNILKNFDHQATRLTKKNPTPTRAWGMGLRLLERVINVAHARSKVVSHIRTRHNVVSTFTL